MRVAVVGLGWVAREVWLPRLAEHPDYTVTAAVEPDERAARASEPLLSGAPVYTDHTQVPDDAADLAFVLTPNRTHGPIGTWFLRRGWSVFLEKPSVVDPDELAALASAASSGRGHIALSAAARFRGDVQTLAELVAGGRLGVPRLAEARWERARGIPGNSWFTTRDHALGGVLLDLGWHLVDVVTHLWGPARIRSATSVAAADFLNRPERHIGWRRDGATESGGDVEDQMTALVDAAEYAMLLRVAWASHEATDRTTITLHGTEGTAELVTTFGFSPDRVDRPSLLLKRSGHREEIPLPPHTIGAEYDRQLDELAGMLADPGTTDRSVAAAADVISVVEACYDSAFDLTIPAESPTAPPLHDPLMSTKES